MARDGDWQEGTSGHQSAVLLALPALAEFTHRWRGTSYAPGHPDLPIERRFPPHVTVLVPWVDDPTSPEALARLRAAGAGTGRLTLTFPRADRFPAGTVFLEPEPADVLMALVRRVHAAFPEHPPYEGAHDDVHLHATVSVEGGDDLLAEVRAALASHEAQHGPLAATVDAVTVWQRGDDDVWREVASVPLD